MPDWAYVRSQTPAAEKRLHFNNAGSPLPTPQVLQAQHDFLDLEGAIGGQPAQLSMYKRSYEALAEQQAAVARPYIALAKLIDCDPDEIAIVTSSTTAWFQASKRHQVEVEIIKEDAEGDVDLSHLEQLIAARPRKPALIGITYIPTSSGRVYSNAADIGAIARHHDIPYLLDGTQAVGQIPVDVQRLGFLVQGVLEVEADCRQALQAGGKPALLDVHGGLGSGERDYELDPTAKRYEVYEMSFAAKVGLGVAVDYVNELGIEAIWKRIQHLAGILRKKLAAVPGAHVHDTGRILCGIVSFSLDGKQPDSVKTTLNQQGINLSVAPAEWTLLDYNKRGLNRKTLRASVHYNNTEDEIDRFTAALQRL